MLDVWIAIHDFDIGDWVIYKNLNVTHHVEGTDMRKIMTDVGVLAAIPVEMLSTRFSDTLDICCMVLNFKKTI